MAQDWTNDNFAPGHVAQTDLTNMEKNFICLRTLFSGAGAPASMAACHPWFDTTKHVFKVRKDDDSAWLGVMLGDTSSKIWIYRNDVVPGWALSAVTDVVLALKGGAAAYNVAGGTLAGTWTQPNHTHGVGSYAGPSHSHSLLTGAAIEYFPGTPIAVSGGYLYTGAAGSGAVKARSTTNAQAGAVTGTSAGGATAVTYRPSAAVGTLQYLDI